MLTLTRIFRPIVLQSIRKLSTTNRLASHELVTHTDTPYNNEDTPFEFTEANMCRLSALIGNYPVGCKRSALGGALDLVQRQIGWIPISAMNRVAEILEIPRIRVYEWATFYTMNKRRFCGKFHVKVCKTTPCMLRGSDIILQAVEKATCCNVGEVTPDCLFGVDTVECAGACANAPVVVVNDDYYEDMTVCDVEVLISTLRGGCIPRSGPQSGRFCCEPITGLTSLTTPPPPPGFMVQPELQWALPFNMR